MKKKIFSVVAAVAVVAAAGWSYQQSKQCYDRGILTGTKCSPSSSKDDKCHYIYDQKGTCN